MAVHLSGEDTGMKGLTKNSVKCSDVNRANEKMWSPDRVYPTNHVRELMQAAISTTLTLPLFDHLTSLLKGISSRVGDIPRERHHQ